MNTENGIVKYIKEDKHTKYMACAQYIDWILGNLVQNIREAYIVQEVYYINASDKEIKSVHYFEAWKIEDGICIKRDGQECDDIFSVGRPIDDSDTFKDSIGHEGIIAFEELIENSDTERIDRKKLLDIIRRSPDMFFEDD